MNHEVDTCAEVTALLRSLGVGGTQDTCEENTDGMSSAVFKAAAHWNTAGGAASKTSSTMQRGTTIPVAHIVHTPQ